MLGGSSGLNGMAWNRATSDEYDAWGQFSSRFDWNWDGLLPFFKKSETISLSPPNPYPGITREEAQDAIQDMQRVDGFSGRISVTNIMHYTPILLRLTSTPRRRITLFTSVLSLCLSNLLTRWDSIQMPSRLVSIYVFIRTGSQLVWILQLGGNNLGVSDTYASIDRKQGARSYSATAYYCQQPERSNLHVLTGAQVIRPIFIFRTVRNFVYYIESGNKNNP